MATATSNPVFSNRVFAGYRPAFGYSQSAVMTVQGTIGKSFLLGAILSATAIWSWSQIAQGALSQGFLIGSVIGGAILAILTCVKPNLAPWTAPVYAAFEGLFLGALSKLVDLRFPGLAIQAVALSSGTLFCMLFVYGSGLVRVTERFKAGVIAATGAICLVYLISLALRLFGVSFPFIHGSGPIGIVFSLFVVGLAAFNLLLDFDFVERAARAGAPRYMEWYGAFGLMVTLVWLYIEILDLLMKLQGRNSED